MSSRPDEYYNIFQRKIPNGKKNAQQMAKGIM
jgi:hypothetical protein